MCHRLDLNVLHVREEIVHRVRFAPTGCGVLVDHHKAAPHDARVQSLESCEGTLVDIQVQVKERYPEAPVSFDVLGRGILYLAFYQFVARGCTDAG